MEICQVMLLLRPDLDLVTMMIMLLMLLMLLSTLLQWAWPWSDLRKGEAEMRGSGIHIPQS